MCDAINSVYLNDKNAKFINNEKKEEKLLCIKEYKNLIKCVNDNNRKNIYMNCIDELRSIWKCIEK